MAEKRRISDSDDPNELIPPQNNSGIVRPPPKKRFTTATNAGGSSASYSGGSMTNGESRSAIDVVVNGDGEENAESDPFNLEEFQKDAIFRQMQEYKRECARLERRTLQFEEQQVDYEAQLSAVNVQWEQFQDDLRMLTSRMDEDGQLSKLILYAEKTKDKESNFLKRLTGLDDDDPTAEVVSNALKKKAEFTKAAVVRLLETIQGWLAKRERFLADLAIEKDPSLWESRVLMGLREEHEKLTSLYQRNQKSIDSLQERCHVLTGQVASLKDELQMTRNRLATTAERLEDTRGELQRAEKRLDRSKSAAVAAITAMGSSSGTGAAPNSTIPITLAEAGTPGSAPDDMNIDGNVKDQVAYYRGQCEARLKELNEVKEERIRIKQEIDLLKVQIHNIPDDRVMDTSCFKQLQLQCNHYKARTDDLEDRAARLSKELEELNAGRRQFVEQMKSEQLGQAMTLEAEMRRLESDLTRIRGQRDYFQQLLDEQKSMGELERKSTQEMKVLAETRKERIESLTASIQRLKMKASAEAGDREAFDFYSTNGEIALVDDLREKLKQSEERLADVTRQLEAYREATEDVRNIQKLMASEYKWRQQAEMLQRKVDEWDRRYGITKAAEGDPLHAMTQKLNEKDGQVNEKDEQVRGLEMKVEFYEKTETQLLNEIENVGRAYAQLEEQNSRKVFDLTQKEDHIAKLLAEKMKYAQTFTSLNKSKDAQTMYATSLKKQSEKQLEHIRQLLDREKNLNGQLTNLERELTSTNGALEVHKTKLVDLTQQNAEMKQKITSSDNRFTELQKLLKDKTRSLEEEIHSKRRAEEEVDSLKRKLETLTKVDNPAEQKLQTEVDQLKTLLKCNSCNTNLKSHIILKCMHTFCKTCIDARIDTRQRKCPNCGESFGIGDVKQFWL